MRIHSSYDAIKQYFALPLSQSIASAHWDRYFAYATTLFNECFCGI